MGFGPEITITISLNFIHFQWKENQLQLEPFVMIDPNKKTPVSIGENSTLPEAISIGLFDPKSDLPADIDKFDVLQMFFNYGIGKMFEKKAFPSFRPLVIVRGDYVLKEIMGGYQRILLTSAIINGGARAVKFE